MVKNYKFKNFNRNRFNNSNSFDGFNKFSKLNKFNKLNNNLGSARPFDSSYAHSILTGSIGSSAFSPLFFGDNVYTKTIISENKNNSKISKTPTISNTSKTLKISKAPTPTIKKYGNIWIKLSGTFEPHVENNIVGDFAKAEEVAKDYGLFDEMPNDYVWHYVFMGWFDYRAFSQMNINQLQCASTEDILSLLKPEPPTISHLYDLTIAQKTYRNNKMKVLDARFWSECFKHDFDSINNWVPDDRHYSLLQLVPKSIHDSNSTDNNTLDNGLSKNNLSTNNENYHQGSEVQYQTYCQIMNIHRKYCYDMTNTNFS